MPDFFPFFDKGFLDQTLLHDSALLLLCEVQEDVLRYV